MTNCINCKMQITGVVCADTSENDLCFECWYSSLLSADETIACPKCDGLGKIKQLYGKPKLCFVCEGRKRISKADVAEIKLPVKRKRTVKYKEIEVPF